MRSNRGMPAFAGISCLPVCRPKGEQWSGPTPHSLFQSVRRATRSRVAPKAGAKAASAPPSAGADRPKGFARPWRAFVRHESLGSSGRPDLAELAQRYHALTPQQRAGFERLGKEAHDIRRQGALRGFGPNTRDVERAARRDEREMRAQRLQLAGLASAEPQLAIADGPGQVLTLAAMAQDWEAVVELKKDLAAASARAAQEARDLSKALSSFEDSVDHEGRKFIDCLVAAGPGLAAASPTLQGMGPLGSCSHVKLGMDPTVKVARLAAPLSRQGSAVGKGMAAALSAKWDKMHEPVAPADCPPCTKRHEPDDCATCGYCLCSPAGLIMERMRRSLCKVLKTELSKCSHSAAKLTQGKFALCLTGVSVRLAPDGTIGDADRVVHWLHWAYHHGSPWRPTFQLATCEAVGSPPECRFLRGAGEWATVYDIVHRLDQALNWSVECFEEVESCVLLGRFVADGMLITSSGSGSQAKFWPPPAPPRKRSAGQGAGRRQKRRRPPPQLGPSPVHEDIAGAIADVDEQVPSGDADNVSDVEADPDDGQLGELMFLADLLEEAQVALGGDDAAAHDPLGMGASEPVESPEGVGACDGAFWGDDAASHAASDDGDVAVGEAGLAAALASSAPACVDGGHADEAPNEGPPVGEGLPPAPIVARVVCYAPSEAALCATLARKKWGLCGKP